jgi:hypothetical protein
VVYSRFGVFFFIGLNAIACSSESSGGGGASNGGAAGLGGAVATGGVSVGSGGVVASSGGQTMASSGGVMMVGMGGTRPVGMGGSTVIAAGGMSPGGGGTPSGGSTGTSGAAGNAGAGIGGASMGGAGGSSGASNGGASGAGGTSGGSASITGTIGALGAVKPIVNAWVISNSGETLIYMSTAPLTCMMMQTMGVGWLSKLPAGSQVVEIVVKGTPSAKTYPVGPLQGEVNYAPGGMSSAYEKNATGGSITFTSAMANGPVEGSVMATYAMGSIMGTFHAEFCSMGSQY